MLNFFYNIIEYYSRKLFLEKHFSFSKNLEKCFKFEKSVFNVKMVLSLKNI